VHAALLFNRLQDRIGPWPARKGPHLEAGDADQPRTLSAGVQVRRPAKEHPHLVEHLKDDCEFNLLTADRILGDTEPYIQTY
jgi:hypothetical protein